ncbi:cation transporter [Ramlibacter sp. G-1-2-2]|uniref:Cation transporter n=1 Tax=Ramlibacter agri TaxID=2728837 RepID=A0A848HI14_9BURK|nr:cation diffusion facilitator family transporter [Ramlibacter agri]NML47338.1 cation transporter [Ramlibacter agri]
MTFAAAKDKIFEPQQLLRWSIWVAVLTLVLKFAAWWLTGSVGLLSDAMESIVNVVGAAFALMMVKIAERPADEDHPYGHHKAEYFSAGFEGMLIIIAAAGIFGAAVFRLRDPQPLEQLGIGLSLSVVGSALNGGLAWLMFRSAREHRSMALEGDARHLMTDVWTSVGVIVGVSLAAFTGWLWLDPVVAMGVAVNIVREGVMLMWRSAEGLMDSALEPEVLADVEKTLAQFKHHAIRFDHVSTRRSGKRRFVDLHMHMPASWTLRRAAALRASVEQALMSAVPGLRATIQLLPSDVEPHSADEEDLI